MALAAAAAQTASAQSTSAHYRLQRETSDAAGATASAAGSRLTASLAQESVVGASSSPHFLVQSGLWAFLGSPLVPVDLMVTRNPLQPAYVSLAWTGNEVRYGLYRNTACASVFANLLATTTANAYNDVTSPPTGLTCYNVIGDGPGPVPSP